MGDDLVIVTELSFIRNMSLLIDQESPRTVQNYMIWRFVMDQVGYMPKRFRAIQSAFNQIFQGVTTVPARSKSCASYVNNAMGLAVSKLYIKKYFDPNARNQVIQ